MKQLKGIHHRLLLPVLLFLGISSCKKFITAPLSGTETYTPEIFSDDAKADAAILGIYGEMIGANGFASGNTRSITFLSALSSDELSNHAAIPLIREFYQNTISTGNKAIENALWGESYKCIYAANAAIAGLQQSVKVTDSAKRRLSGEAFFIRAFCHFYLVNLFGDVPYITKTDHQVNSRLQRLSQTAVYRLIIQDLQEAEERLSVNYPGTERIRPNKWSVTALLARTLLYTGDWAGAEARASAVIEYTNMYRLADSLQDVFLINSPEAIWQLKPNTTGINTWEGKNFILNAAPATGEGNSAALSRHLLDVFEKGDLRRACWVDSIVMTDSTVYHFPYKYKVKNGGSLSEYSMVLRLAEQYLIRAEARAHQGDVAGARADLNVIRKRAGLSATTASTVAALLTAIARERQVELFTEWGHRWLDLKRTGQAGQILGPIKASGWEDTDILYPIPRNECLLNPLLTQNPGYE